MKDSSATASKKIVLLRGDGIGPEIADAVVDIFDRAGARLDWQIALAGAEAIKTEGEPLPAKTLELIKAAGVALKCPLETPVATGFRSVNVQLRKELDLYANLRPVKSLPGIKTKFDDIDLVFVRENTEGLYSGLEHEVVPGVVTSLKVATRKASLRIAEFAFNYAEQNGRKKVTAVHKANIMKLSDGLAIQCYREVANQHPEIEYEERIVDATAMYLVLDPGRFDVLVMENLYGDILSDLGAGLIGGLGLAPSGNFGTNGAVFEAVHGTAPDIAGKGLANPTALLLSATAMLRYLNQQSMATRIESAVYQTLAAGKKLTRDLGGNATTMEFANEIVSHLT